MPLIIPPGFVSASFVLTGSDGTEPYVTTLGLDTSAYGGDFVSAANQAKAIYHAAFTSETNDALTLDRVSLAIGSDGPSGSVDSTTEPNPMTNTGTFAPTAMSVIARKQTATYGRRGRGRMFLPGTVLENAVEADGSLTPSAIVGYNAALNYFYETLTEGDAGGAPLPPVLFHSQAPADPTPILSFSVAPLVGWIRGRIR